ncbi:hypothetical protein BTO30_14105 [Domibacillus antri]|uniref:Nuclease SbcCD subunit C n=1 Tax=Domibacillus antri TaxID=1714264 RepID=A0A1Q8Q2T5_9BACI|nr:DUF3732 domain-containing protein [Domibacillus antri]OLN21611.1 hypothetical protein BTO30_14105 [Domibacillus antri]
MQIIEIVLYSKKGQKRTLKFEVGRTNIITGGSGTGKSALIDIIEYCLGRDTCMVPEGIIRETVSWYGLRIKYSQGEMFIARENPDLGRASTNSAYIEEGELVQSPLHAPEANTTNEALVDTLSRKIGISPNLHTPLQGQTRPPLEANIKHALFYCLQQQDEIASKRTLFHRQSEEFIGFAQKDTLPYFLGAVQEDRLAIEQNLTRSKRELKKAERALKEVQLIRGEGVTQAVSLLAEANEVGLTNLQTYPSELEAQIAILEKTINWIPGEVNFPEVDKLTQLQLKLQDLKDNFNNKSEEIRAAKTFTSEAEGYAKEIQQQEFRLESINLFNNIQTDVELCPLCSNKLDTPIPSISAINNSLSRVKKNLEATIRERPRLREYIEKKEEEKQKILDEINQINKIIDGIYNEGQAARELRDLNVRRSRVIGRISLWLESVNLNEDYSDLEQAVEELKEKVSNLESQLDNEEKELRIQSILNRIGFQMTEWANNFDIEHSGNPVRLDISKLTVVIDKVDRAIPLYRIGSGENWVAYHLIAHLALHKYFTKQNRPVPRFLFLDQPTQVYYPREKDEKLLGSIEFLKDEDREAVKKMFDLIFEVVKELEPNFQVIITDHADLKDESFQEHVTERWRDGKALIPDSWIEGTEDIKTKNAKKSGEKH